MGMITYMNSFPLSLINSSSTCQHQFVNFGSIICDQLVVKPDCNFTVFKSAHITVQDRLLMVVPDLHDPVAESEVNAGYPCPVGVKCFLQEMIESNGLQQQRKH